MKYYFSLFLLIISYCSKGQDIQNIILSHNESGQDIESFLKKIETSYPIKFRYLPEWFDGITLKKDYVNTSLLSVLHDAFIESDVSFDFYYNYYVVFYKDEKSDRERQRIQSYLADANNQNIQVVGSVELFELGKSVKINGTIKDIRSAQPIIGASILIKETSNGSYTNTEGKYSLELEPGIYSYEISSINYEPESGRINVVSNGEFNMDLFESTISLDDVTILSEREDQNITSAQVGKEKLGIESIKELPTFLGEVDVIKSIQLLPGVASIGEGASGFNVRGGSVDQNLVLLDGAQIFNYSHFLGFFSAFNPSTVKDVTLYRGGIPAEYGQRLSSILDVGLKDGNKEKFKAEGGIGLVSSNLMVEGPIIKDKTSMLLGGRISYSDWILRQAQNRNVQNSEVSFYDLNARISHKINEKNHLSFNSYLSKDQFSLGNDTTYHWSTYLFTMKYNHLFNENLVGNFSASSGRYNYEVNEPEQNNAFELSFGVKYQQLSANFEAFSSKHKLKFGIQGNYYQFQPGKISPTSNSSNINSFELESEQGLETGIYLSDEYQINSSFSLIAGLRYSSYTSLGSQSIAVYENGFPKSIDTIIDTLSYGPNESIKTYHGLEPRLSLRYLLNSQNSFKLGYNRIFQYVHLISNTAAVTPLDIWQSSNYHIEPQMADQISLGYFKNIRNNEYEMSLEVYFKKISNLLEYKNGAQLLLNENLEADLIQGEGRAYGLEIMVKKTKGRLTGWGSYTFSQSENKINSQYSEETIGNGQYYPSNYNKPHDFTFVSNYKLSKRFALNANFTFSTGRPITAPISKYEIGDVAINNYSLRNQYKIPDYHRLDIGLTIKTNHKKHKFWEGNWNISIYNVYGRKNAYSVFFEEDQSGTPVAKQISILGAPFPSISYNFKI